MNVHSAETPDPPCIWGPPQFLQHEHKLHDLFNAKMRVLEKWSEWIRYLSEIGIGHTWAGDLNDLLDKVEHHKNTHVCLLGAIIRYPGKNKTHILLIPAPIAERILVLGLP